ncbi:LLM class flavin-dependent oxidoreductase [Actinocorallia populi]|uniref:LLM class flavin-dependent oxidoreductase n=1 Tax=Actinocorallia populi TaxID=2079200 RepID=UPI000D096BAF|nr:LLM class flavin-dependent oxidoreductase [Actinocorallia populi]
MRFHWFLPTTGDGNGIRTAIMDTDRRLASGRPASVRYLSQVARAAEDAGFEAVLTPVGAGCPDPWIVCSAVAQHTERLQMLVAFRPGFALPTLLAQQAQAFQEVSGGRLALNVVTGGDPVEQRSYGDFLDHDARYARTEEFLDVLKRSFTGVPFDHEGEHYRIAGGGLAEPLERVPELYFGGSSPAAERVASRHADVALTWGEPPAAVAPKVERLRERAAARGRTLRVGLRVHVIARDTSAEAWAVAERLLAGMDPARIEAAQRRFARYDSVAQRAMTDLHGGGTRDLEVSPGLWAGVGLVREGAGTALVGSYEEVAALLREYAGLGVEEFILSGWPHLEEAYRVGENIVPRLAPVTA